MWRKRTSYGKKWNLIKSRFVPVLTIQALALKLNKVKLCFHPQNPTVSLVSFFCLRFIYPQHCTPKIGQVPFSSRAGKRATWTQDLLPPYSKSNFKFDFKKDEKNLKEHGWERVYSLWLYDRSHKNILNTAFPKMTNFISDVFMYGLD